MKKEDLKNSIDLIEPDPYMGTRLKSKMSVRKTSTVSFKKIGTCGVAVALIFALLFGFNPSPSATVPSTSDIQTNEGFIRQVNPFIMVANAAEAAENPSAEYTTLKLNETFPFAYKISFVDVRGMNEFEREDVVLKAQEMLDNYIGNTNTVDYNMACVRSFPNIIFTESLENNIKLNLTDKENIKSINVKNSSEWGYVEYYDWKLIDSEIDKGNTRPIPHGNDITITAEQYHQDSGGFHWKNSYKLDNAINDNPDIPLSTFTDTITFTVEYLDGSKEIGVIDVVFDDEGNGSFTLRDYSYSEN